MWLFYICVKWLNHMCDMTQSYVWHGSIICLTWLNHMCDMKLHVNFSLPKEASIWIKKRLQFHSISFNFIQFNSTPTPTAHLQSISFNFIQFHSSSFDFIHVNAKTEGNCLIFMCDMTHVCVYGMIYSCVQRDSFILVTWLMCVYNMIYSCVWHDSFIVVTWQVTRKNAPCHTYERLLFAFFEHKFGKDIKGLSHLRDMSHSYAWHAWFAYVTCLIHMRDARMTGLSRLRDMSDPYAWHAWFTYVTWLIHMCDTTRPSIPTHLVRLICVTRLFTCVTTRYLKKKSCHFKKKLSVCTASALKILSLFGRIRYA